MRNITRLLLLTSLLTVFACGKASIESAKQLLNNTTNESNSLKGNLSPNFGTGGIVLQDIVEFSTSGNEVGNQVLIDETGSIFVAGSGGPLANAALWKFDSTGALDTSFGGGDGLFTHKINSSDRVNDMAIDSLGNIILVGKTFISGEADDLAVWKITPSGVLDTTFGGGNGYVTHRTGSGSSYYEEGHSVTIDANDNIIVSGSTVANGAAIWKFTSTGVLDTSFGGGNGFVLNATFSYANGVTVDENDNIYTAGNGGGIKVVKYDSNGNLDSSFSGDGSFEYDNPSGSEGTTDIVLDSNGNVVITGYLDSGADRDMLVMRLTPTGVLDTTFGSGQGYITHHNAASGNGNDIGSALALDSDGNILVIGDSEGSNSDIAIWKLSATGSLVTSFGDGDGFLVLDDLAGGNGTDKGYGLALTDSGKLVATGMSYSATTGEDMFLFLLE